jgi:predicted nucleic acid-binding Zn ribbon protein
MGYKADGLLKQTVELTRASPGNTARLWGTWKVDPPRVSMESCIQRLFQHHFPQYRSTHGVSLRELRAAESIMACRTAKLGGHIESCPQGHFIRAHYNSCKHRSCTQCNGLLKERWLLGQKARLLDCSHYHIIFTVPHEFVPLWLYNRSAFMNLLFQGAHEALTTLLSDPRYLGAQPGMLMSFHSWGRNLSLHPHVHCLITNGGLDEDEQWRTPKRSHFLPAKVLMLVFRGIMARLLHRALEQAQLTLPADTESLYWHRLVKQTKAKAWNVNLRERYEHGTGVATYLARYVRGGPLRDKQLSISNQRVQMQYVSHQTHRTEHISFSIEQFLQRFLQHVPDKGSQVVRGFGLYANGQTQRLNVARVVHEQAPAEKPDFLNWQHWLQQLTDVDHRHCPHCQKPLLMKVMPRQQSPPTRWCELTRRAA